MPELRAWRAAGPRLVRVVRGVKPQLARVAQAVAPGARRITEAVRPGVTRFTGVVKPHVARVTRAARGPHSGRLTTPQLTAAAATMGLVLAAGAATAAGPWDSSGQRTAERDRASVWAREGGTDHGRGSGTTAGGPAPAPSAASVLTALGAAADTTKSDPAAKALTDVLGPLLRDGSLGTRRSAAVVDVAGGKRLYGEDADEALTPASTTKIATAVAALSAVGADHRFSTRAVLEPGTDHLVLVGGGDPTLTARAQAGGTSLLMGVPPLERSREGGRSRELGGGWASLRTLADETAAALKKRHLASVTLAYDTSLFTGPALHPIGVNENLAPVTSLMADEGRMDDTTSGPAPRSTDPAADAARTFAGLLQGHGITTSRPGTATATTRAEALASVQSPPLSAVVERMLTNSDNDIAEALARQTALATGGQPSFEGGAAAIADRLKKLGLPLGGARFADGSGLSRDDKLTADLLTALLATAASPAHPELRSVLTGLPVAGFTGTLSDRYEDAATHSGVGLVRAKTGSLTGVNTLAGTVVDADGRLLAFAFLTEGSMDQTTARTTLDHTAATLAMCGCR